MLRLSKVADYGLVLLAHLAREDEPRTHNARELAHEAELPAPMVSKILKELAREGLLESQRGAKGGYALSRPPEEISLADVICALQGPVALTECVVQPALCEHEASCTITTPAHAISRVIERALADVSLADLVSPAFGAAGAASASTPTLQIMGREATRAGASAAKPLATHEALATEERS